MSLGREEFVSLAIEAGRHPKDNRVSHSRRSVSARGRDAANSDTDFSEGRSSVVTISANQVTFIHSNQQEASGVAPKAAFQGENRQLAER